MYLLKAVLLFALPLAAQPHQQRHTETQEYPVAAAAGLSVDARPNGGISVQGWDRSDILVRARVETYAPSVGEAQAMARQIRIVIEGSSVRTDAPDFGSGRGASVSYEVFVPLRIDLILRTVNGGIHIAGVAGELEFDTRNGGVSLQRLAGSVKGSTRNGGLSIELAGSRWEGETLDVNTRNGGIFIEAPSEYSARLETSTVNGRLQVDHPGAQVVGDKRDATITFGSGGALLRVHTVNGGVSVKASRPVAQ